MAKMIRLKSTFVDKFLLGIFRNCMYLLVRIGLPLSGIAFNQKTTLTQSVMNEENYIICSNYLNYLTSSNVQFSCNFFLEGSSHFIPFIETVKLFKLNKVI